MKKNTYLWILVAINTYGQEIDITKQFKEYWYAGKAEVSSYELEQARYGELRKGHAVNIFVTEPFSKKYNTKANNYSDPDNTTVLKLNATKKFNTGIYPYSIMTSTFLPVSNPKASLKISSSTQEWCGHEYIELVNNNGFKLSNFSYFQGESFKNKKIDKAVLLEDDIWSRIRLTPNALPQGDFIALPSFVYLRFSHKQIKAYSAKGTLTKGLKTSVYEISYKNLNRSLKITFQNQFPYKIMGWVETFYSGWGNSRKLLTTKATLKKTLLVAYWEVNSNKDAYLRKELGLK